MQFQEKLHKNENKTKKKQITNEKIKDMHVDMQNVPALLFHTKACVKALARLQNFFLFHNLLE